MPINELIRHLRVLDAQASWRKSQLPKEITPDVLNQLDVAGLIEVKLWGRHTIGGGKSDRPLPRHWHGRCGWYVASDHRGIAGTLDQILAHPEYQGEYEPEFHVSPTGAQWLLRERGDKPEGAPAVDSTPKVAPAHRRAAESYEWVCREQPGLMPKEARQKYTRKQWDYLRQHGCPAYTNADDTSIRVPDFETWKRQVRAGLADPKNPNATTRTGRPHGKSIVNAEQI